jgi:hypothetical protein
LWILQTKIKGKNMLNTGFAESHEREILAVYASEYTTFEAEELAIMCSEQLAHLHGRYVFLTEFLGAPDDDYEVLSILRTAGRVGLRLEVLHNELDKRVARNG